MYKGYPWWVIKYFPRIGLLVDAASQHKGFFYFLQRSKQFEYDPKAKNITRVMKTNAWFLFKEPLNSSSDFNISEEKLHSGEVEMFCNKNLNLLIFSIVHALKEIYSY